jgi:hypothetical protein
MNRRLAWTILAVVAIPGCARSSADTARRDGGAGAVQSGTAAAPSTLDALSTDLAPGSRTSPAITEADLRTRVFIFADDSMLGRNAPGEGDRKAADYLAGELKRLGLEPAGENGTYFQEVPMPRVGAASPAPGPVPTGRNVVAVLRGSDPALRGQYVAIGAHKDHEGISYRVVDHDSARAVALARMRLEITGRGPSPQEIRATIDSIRRLRPARRDSVFNGADDDGSGSMAMLEIAEAMVNAPTRPRRSVLFVWHTGEEDGLVGSGYFTSHPTVPRDSIVAQVNLDMIGRGGADDTPGGGPDYLMVVGHRRLSTELGDLVDSVNARQAAPLRFDLSWDDPNHPQQIYGRSDHASYARYRIPVVFFFTGLHADYHEVTDEPQYLDYPHYTRIVKYIHDVVRAIGDRPARLRVNR